MDTHKQPPQNPSSVADLLPPATEMPDLRSISDSVFALFWLSEGEIDWHPMPNWAYEELTVSSDIFLSAGFLGLKGAKELFSNALNHGFPPLPAETALFENLVLTADQQNNFLKPKHGTELWENLQGTYFQYVNMRGALGSWTEGSENIRTMNVHLQDIHGSITFDRLPKLEADDYHFSELDIWQCPALENLNGDLTSYLKTAECCDVWVTIRGCPVSEIDPKLLAYMARNFESSVLVVKDSRLSHGFMEHIPEAWELVADREMGFLFTDTLLTFQFENWIRERTPDRSSVPLKLKTDIQPLMKPDIPERLNWAVYSDPDTPRPELELLAW